MASAAPEPVTVTLLLTDLVDSTRLVAELGDAQATALMAAHDRQARDLLVRHRGREIDKSDGFLLLFSEAADGVGYALDYHAALRELSATLGRTLAARAGLHTGEVRLLWNAPEDVARGAKPCEVEGIAKATAARIMTLALGGQVLLSPATRAQLPDPTPPIRLLSHGHFRLKGVPEPLELFEVGAPPHAPMRPPPDSAKVHRVVQVAGSWRPAQEIPHSLPPEQGRFFGRDADRRAIADAFDGGARLVTLVGPAGTGKTRLAEQYARDWMGSWPQGVWFCELSEARTALEVAHALGRALAIPLEQGDPIDTLGEALANRGQSLLLLDNLEQVAEAIAPLLTTWRARAPDLGWLLTSRRRLDLPGERLVYVEPLPLPATTAEAEQSPGVQLFVERARAARPDFALTAENIAAVAELIRLLDGLPLAIELAAARVRMLPPERILQRIGRRFDLLAQQRGAASARQATLRGAIDWSWELLSPPERAALAQCALFEGSFDLEAAEAVLDVSAWPDAPWPMDLVEALVDRCLLRASSDGRLTMLRSIAEYSAEKLDDPDAAPGGTGPEARQTAEARHAQHFARWGEVAAQDALYRSGGAARAQLQADQPNLIAALQRSARAGDGATAALSALGVLALMRTSGPLPLAAQLGGEALAAQPPPVLAARLQVALGVVWNRSGRAEEAIPLLEAALATARAQRQQDRLEADALAALGHGAVLRGAYDEALEYFSAALAIQRRIGARREEALSLTELAHVEGIRGTRFARARQHLEQALAIFSALGDSSGEAVARSYLGALCCVQGALDEGRAAYEQARALAQQTGDRRTEGLAEGMIAAVCLLQGDLATARRRFLSALAIQRSIGDRVHEAMHATNYADLLHRLGELEEATQMLERAVDIARQIGDRVTEGTALGSLGSLLAERGQPEAGRARLLEGEALLRDVGDPTELGKLLCRAASIELDLGEPVRARSRAQEARMIASSLGVSEGAELAEMLRALDERLG